MKFSLGLLYCTVLFSNAMQHTAACQPHTLSRHYTDTTNNTIIYKLKLYIPFFLNSRCSSDRISGSPPDRKNNVLPIRSINDLTVHAHYCTRCAKQSLADNLSMVQDNFITFCKTMVLNLSADVLNAKAT